MKFLTWNIKDGGVLDFNNPKVDNIDNILNIIKMQENRPSKNIAAASHL